jgi:hypothetical protein
MFEKVARERDVWLDEDWKKLQRRVRSFSAISYLVKVTSDDIE